MIYLPDTNAVITLIRKPQSSVAVRFQQTPSEEIILCDVVKAELWHGAYKSGHFEKNQTLLNGLFAKFASLPFEGTAAKIYGRIRRELEAVGTPVGTFDLQIAAIALANGLTIITHNAREFSRIASLSLVDWEI